MANVLDKLGYDTDPCTPGNNQPGERYTHIYFGGKGPLKLNMDSDIARTVRDMFGDSVDFGIGDKFEVAICAGSSRKLTKPGNDRAAVNIETARGNLTAMFPGDGGGKTRLLNADMDDIAVDEDNGVIVFRATGFRYIDGTGLHYCTPHDVNLT